MIHYRLGSASSAFPISATANIEPLNTAIGPSEVLAGTPTPTLAADLTSAEGAQAEVTLQNLSNFVIFYALSGTPGPPALTTANGVQIPAGGYLTLDGIGGMAVWIISGTAQSAGSGTRVAGAFHV